MNLDKYDGMVLEVGRRHKVLLDSSSGKYHVEEQVYEHFHTYMTANPKSDPYNGMYHAVKGWLKDPEVLPMEVFLLADMVATCMVRDVPDSFEMMNAGRQKFLAAMGQTIYEVYEDVYKEWQEMQA